MLEYKGHRVHEPRHQSKRTVYRDKESFCTPYKAWTLSICSGLWQNLHNANVPRNTANAKRLLLDLHADTINFLAPRYLGSLPVSSTHLQPLVVPALISLLIECLLLLAIGHGASFPPALPRVNSLFKGSIIAIQSVSLQVVCVCLLGKCVCTVFSIDPAGACIALASFRNNSTMYHIPWNWLLSSQSSVK